MVLGKDVERGVVEDGVVQIVGGKGGFHTRTLYLSIMNIQ